MIKPGIEALIRGGTFTVMGKSEKKGYWQLHMKARTIRRKNRIISIEIPESEVLEGIEAYQIEQRVKGLGREESVSKDIFKTRFLLTKMDADDPNAR